MRIVSSYSGLIQSWPLSPDAFGGPRGRRRFRGFGDLPAIEAAVPNTWAREATKDGLGRYGDFHRLYAGARELSAKITALPNEVEYSSVKSYNASLESSLMSALKDVATNFEWDVYGWIPNPLLIPPLLPSPLPTSRSTARDAALSAAIDRAQDLVVEYDQKVRSMLASAIDANASRKQAEASAASQRAQAEANKAKQAAMTAEAAGWEAKAASLQAETNALQKQKELAKQIKRASQTMVFGVIPLSLFIPLTLGVSVVGFFVVRKALRKRSRK